MTDKETSLLLERLANRLDSLLEKQEEIADDISKIKEAVYDPDKGVFARVKVLEQQVIEDGQVRISQLESTISNIKRIQWMIIGSALTTLTALFIKDLL
jgi:anion-transporting  ArsA/GET3 family ATPase|tara:strand:- start:1059 stop:1355 length:297 start_codon:yes stop_codon:yes gene_type:complete